MPKAISWRKFIQRLKSLGFDGPYSGGRHLFMVKGELKLHIPNPHQREISAYLLAEILRQAGITKADWERWS
jgi:predicted RNA binding protein YcfA (HicA-like mRNA interferase family)